MDMVERYASGLPLEHGQVQKDGPPAEVLPTRKSANRS